MSQMPSVRMSVDEFLAWAEARPGRHELVDGRVFAMAPERVRHTSTKFLVSLALHQAIGRAGLPCQMLPDGATVRIDNATAFEPDALVRCGPSLDGDLVEVADPILVVEVLSPSTRTYDGGAKLIGYFACPTIMHYLMVDPDRRVVVHHRRDGAAIATRILKEGPIRLDPPGLDMKVEDLFERG